MPLPTSPPRPFGSAAEDLEFDFGSADRPALVTALLDACDPAADHDAWWGRPVGERVAAVLALLRRTSGDDTVALTLRCPAADCGARYDIALAYDALPAPCASPTLTLRRASGEALALRLPTGDDLRAWHEQPPTTREDMLARLAIDDGTGDVATTGTAEALAAADPLVAFEVACTCPECGQSAEHDVDLEGLALQRLAARQRGVLLEVHALASRYGWTEREVFAVAAPRRARYLDLIRGEGA